MAALLGLVSSCCYIMCCVLGLFYILLRVLKVATSEDPVVLFSDKKITYQKLFAAIAEWRSFVGGPGCKYVPMLCFAARDLFSISGMVVFRILKQAFAFGVASLGGVVSAGIFWSIWLT